MTPAEATDIARGLFARWRPNQKESEYVWMAERAAEVLGQPKRILEIGSERGGTLALWSAIADRQARMVAIDLPSSRQNEAELRAVVESTFNVDLAPGASQCLELILADSHLPSTRNRVIGFFEPESVDLCFVDADHSYEGASSDFKDYAPFMRDGGIMLFHDILPHESVPDIEVHRLWSRIKSIVPGHVEEKIENPHQVAMGVGLLRIDTESRKLLGL